jgi:prepilin-type N-terminal cleavage/methylation domain-containing protein
MKNTKKAFTLVELIVVITILAVLGTIAFVSFGSYSADARNTKRTADMNGLQSKIAASTTGGTPLLALVDTDETDRGLTVGDVDIQGEASKASNYKAGKVNFQVLGEKNEDFKDPTDVDYSFAATSKLRGKFEFGAKLEDGAGSFITKINGNYNPRAVAADSEVTTVGDTGTTDKTMKITPDSLGKLSVGDVLSVGGNPKIVKISNDLQTITLDSAPNTIVSSGATVKLAVIETSSLLSQDGGTTAELVDGSTTAFPY